MSRPDRSARVGVDFAPPRKRGGRPLLALAVLIVMLAAILIAVTQLLLR